MRVHSVIVSHNGARWLPRVLEGVAAQTYPIGGMIAIDTGSVDESPALLDQALPGARIDLEDETTFPQAVRIALEQLPPAQDDDWVWLLHDDSKPAADCLEHLAAVADAGSPQLAVVGPKVREWPHLRRLLEVGVTISGTGQRETQLEAGEYDQGQHDEVDTVLAVNTAGMLVRRSVLEEYGFDDNLPLFGNDLEFGWRLARAGLETKVEPAALLFHVEAAHRGLRESRLGRHPRTQERAGAIYTLLVNSTGIALPWRVVRLFCGGMLRVLGLLLVREVDEAVDEFLGIVSGLGSVRSIVAARKLRKPQRVTDARHLLAPGWLPYRRGLDYLGDVWVAATMAVADFFNDELHDRPWWQRVFLTPLTWGVIFLIVSAGLLYSRWWGAGDLHGGALLGAPQRFSGWWSLWGSGWHWLGDGSGEPAAPYVLLLACASVLTMGNPGAVIWLLLAFAVPLAGVGAFRLAHRIFESAWVRLWFGLSYALVVVATGALGNGQLGAITVGVIAPWVALTSLGLASLNRETRSRATWRSALGATLMVAFAPPTWLVIAALVAISGWLCGHRLRVGNWLPLVLAPLIFCLPWLLETLTTPGIWLFEAGRARPGEFSPGVFEVLAGRASAAHAAPVWVGVCLLALGLLALLRKSTRTPVLRSWGLVACAGLVLGIVAWSDPHVRGAGISIRPYHGSLAILVQLGLLLALASAATGLVRLPDWRSWRELAAAAGVATAVLLTTVTVGWWASADIASALKTTRVAVLPQYMQALAEESNSNAVLVVRGGNSDARSASSEARASSDVSYQVLRRGHVRIGDDSVLMAQASDGQLSKLLARALADTDSEFAQELASRGIAYVYAPAPVSEEVSGAFDATADLLGASEPRSGTRAWQVGPERSLDGISKKTSWWHPLLLVIQVLEVVVILVLVAPSRRQRSTR